MKTFIILIIVLFGDLQFAQMNPGRAIEFDQNKDFIQHQIRALQNALNDHSGKYLNSILTKDAVSDEKTLNSNLISNYQLVEIKSEDISVTNDKAIAACQIKIYSENENVQLLKDTLKLKRVNNKWIFDDLSKLTAITKEALSKIKGDGIESLTGYNLVTPFVNDRAQILDAHYLSPEIFEINADVTMNYVDRQLYGWGSEIDAAIYVYGVNPFDNTILGSMFTLDTKWNRVLYSKYGGDDTKSYGDHPNDVKFADPVSIDVNEYGEVFILDNLTHQLHKLQYSYSNNILSYIGVVGIPDNILSLSI